jgi:RNA polymerase sigma factor (TIGR02999 family)
MPSLAHILISADNLIVHEETGDFSMDADRSSITRLLQQSRGGNKAAFDELIPVVYDRLYRLASRRLSSERQGHTLKTTEIVHEAYLRLVDSDIAWADRGHFYAIAAQVMRRILIDYAKSRNRNKRGGEFERVTLDSAFELGAPSSSNLLEVNEALERLSARDARKGTVIELLVFGGLTYDEAAESLGISAATLHRELRLAKAWLHRELTSKPPVTPGRSPAPTEYGR